ncbi:MAG: hypothetical protein QGD93_09300 [Actinomycetota bacterium]|nr:hypothetical protein [Actinomycetota bacterium]
MAGFVGYKKAAWQNATPAQRAFLSTILSALGLGEPAEYEAPGGTRWFVFSDWRIDSRFVENLAWANHQIANITDKPIRDYPVDENDDPLTQAAGAQGKVAWFSAAGSLPVNWVTVEPD